MHLEAEVKTKGDIAFKIPYFICDMLKCVRGEMKMKCMKKNYTL